MWWVVGNFWSEDVKNQDLAPLNAILDQLSSKEHHGVFEAFMAPQKLLLESKWADRFEPEPVELGGHNLREFDLEYPGIVRTDTGLQLTALLGMDQSDSEEEEDSDE